MPRILIPSGFQTSSRVQRTCSTSSSSRHATGCPRGPTSPQEGQTTPGTAWVRHHVDVVKKREKQQVDHADGESPRVWPSWRCLTRQIEKARKLLPPPGRTGARVSLRPIVENSSQCNSPDTSVPLLESSHGGPHDTLAHHPRHCGSREVFRCRCQELECPSKHLIGATSLPRRTPSGRCLMALRKLARIQDQRVLRTKSRTS